jgi:hypothetical protein
MGICASCGNEYDATFTIQMKDRSYEFDCFECAINLLAPKCRHCGTRIIGHGAQDGDVIFCSAHCARLEGDHVLNDRHKSRLIQDLDSMIP